MIRKYFTTHIRTGIPLFFILSVLCSVLSGTVCLAQSLKGTIESHSFIGHLSQKTVLYNIYLPEGYATSTERYPVIYHLNGLGDTPSSHNITIAEPFEYARDSGVIGSVIIVYPNSYGYTFWADSIDSTKPAETNVIYELIPHIDSTYRTIAQRKYRIVQGWSMGGFGAALYITKFPNLFNGAILYDAALFPWSTLTTLLPDTAREIFGNNEAYFNQYSPWRYAGENAALFQSRTSLRIVVAAITSYNREYRDYLNSLSIYPAYTETTSVHIVSQVIAAEGYNSIIFIANLFHSSATPTKIEKIWQLYSQQNLTIENFEHIRKKRLFCSSLYAQW
ncbi:MAG: esterase family protein [bacterium]|nr:esterase family protein [bacterium]